jgi:hypothetical protein
MSQLTDEQLQNTNSVIANGLEAKKMRHKIENKDLLSQKGALYVGTGNTTSTGAAVTTSIAPNSETDDGKVLIANSTANEGWQIGKITASNIEDGAVSPTKLNLQSDYAVKTLTVHATDSLDEQFAKYTNTGIEYAGTNDSLNTLVYPTELPDTTGTVATKEQIENGDIIAKTASSLKGNSSSQNQLFTSKKGTQNWAEFHEQSVLSTDGVTSIQLGPKDLTTSNGIISGTFFTPSVDNLGVGLYVVHDIGSHFFGIACIYDIGDQGEYGYDVALWGGIKMTNGKGTLKANTTLRALKIGWVNSLTSAANVFNALGLV